MTLLTLEGLRKDFGGVVALDDVSFEVYEGEILGLIGPNGAGKTTLFNVVSGRMSATGGRIRFDGEDLTGYRLHETAARGLVRTFQHSVMFQEMSVLENVIVAHHLQASTGLWSAIFRPMRISKEARDLRASAEALLNFLDLSSVAQEPAGSLSHGHQRALGIAVALGAQPRLLMLDEPLTGMNSQEILQMVDIIERTRQRGITVVLVEHNMTAVMRVCDRIVVLNFGRKIAEGFPDEVRRDENVIEAYLGESITED